MGKATRLLIPYYAFHISILPIVLLALIAMHYYLIKVDPELERAVVD